MDMKPLNSGKLRSAGYDAARRTLRVTFDDGSALEYSGVGEEIWRRLSASSSAWSFYRDTIEEEFTARKAHADVATSTPPKKNPLDDLFG